MVNNTLVPWASHAPLSGAKVKVERHGPSPTIAFASATTRAVPDASTLAAVEQAKVVAERKAQVEQLEKFNRELQQRVDAAEVAKRDHQRLKQQVTALYGAEIKGAALARAHVSAASAAKTKGGASSALAAATPLDRQRGLLGAAAEHATQMMMDLFEPEDLDVTDGMGPVEVVRPSSSSGKAPSTMASVHMAQAAANRAVAHERRIKKEMDSQRAQIAAKQAKNEAALREVQDMAALEMLRQEKRELEAERAAAMAGVLAAQSSELSVAKQMTETERYVEALRKQLKHEIALRPRPLPSLCACGIDPLEGIGSCARCAAARARDHPRTAHEAPPRLTPLSRMRAPQQLRLL